MTLADLLPILQQLAPLELAAEWDNVGLLLGAPTDPADRVMTCLTVTPNVVAEAVAERLHLIVAHHPILFRGSKNLSTKTADGRLLLPLLRAGIAVYSPHTAWDDAPGGINDQLAQLLGLTQVKPLVPGKARPAYKVVVFVPDADLQRVSDAIFAVGAGIIGQYRECSFRLAGTGTFLPMAGANPTIGQVGRREEAPEWRLEILVPEACLAAAIAAMRANHSYEEPAFDVYPLRTSPTVGSGRVGLLPGPLTVRQLAELVQERLGAASVPFTGDPNQRVERLAILCGSGGKYHAEARQAGADAFLTGEATFHDGLAAEASGLAMLLPGHYATERPAMEELARRLAALCPSATVWASRQERDVFRV